MIELPEQVTITMYKDKRGNLYKTQKSAMIADQAVEKLDLSEKLSAILYYDINLKGYKVCEPYSNVAKDMSEISDSLLEFLSDRLDDILPIVQAYIKVKKAV